MDGITNRLATARERLAARLDARALITDTADMAPFLKEWRGNYRSSAAFVVQPADTAAVAATVAIAGELGLPIVPQGGNTGLVGGSVGDNGSILVNLSRMNRVRSVDCVTDSITVDAGCVLADIQRVAEGHDRLFPLSLAAEGSCQIGGNIATNAGGTAVLRYGTMRDLVLGLEVVTPDGQIWDGLTRLRKNNTGYDLRHLFVGAEGTLGIVTGAALKLFARPRDRATAWAALPDIAAGMALLGRLKAEAGDRLTGFEVMNAASLALVVAHIPAHGPPLPPAGAPWFVLIELTSPRAGDGLADALTDLLAEAAEAGQVLDALVAQNETQAAGFWGVREHIPEAQRLSGHDRMNFDVSVPISAIPEFLAKAGAIGEAALPGVPVAAFGHAGDGNLHYTIHRLDRIEAERFAAAREDTTQAIYAVIAALGGSFSAEHGVGLQKRPQWLRYKSPVEQAMMRAIKQALDPRGLMNPGKILA